MLSRISRAEVEHVLKLIANAKAHANTDGVHCGEYGGNGKCELDLFIDWFDLHGEELAHALLAQDRALRALRAAAVGEMLLSGEASKAAVDAVKQADEVLLPDERVETKADTFRDALDYLN